jgi:hypothetical protein
MTYTYQQQARDDGAAYEIRMSCQAIKRQASYVGVASNEMVRLSAVSEPMVMDELNEAEGVLRRALARIENAKQTLLSKTLVAAE